MEMASGDLIYVFTADDHMAELDHLFVPADEVEDAFFPQPSDIIDAVHEHVLPLKGYTPVRECSQSDLMRRSAQGV